MPCETSVPFDSTKSSVSIVRFNNGMSFYLKSLAVDSETLAEVKMNYKCMSFSLCEILLYILSIWMKAFLYTAVRSLNGV